MTWYKKVGSYVKFLLGVGWFGGRTYAKKRYGIDIGPKPDLIYKSDLDATCRKHDDAYYIPGYLKPDTFVDEKLEKYNAGL